MKLRKILFSAVAVLGIASLSSCNSSDAPSDGLNYFVDIATLESTGDSGSVLTLRKMGDSPLVTLLTKQRFDSKEFTVGKRIVMIYHPESNMQYESGNIVVSSAAETFGGGDAPKVSTSAEMDKWASDPIRDVSVWRTGEYLNFRFVADAFLTTNVEECQLYFDAATEGSENPHFHLIYDAGKGINPQQVEFYASFNIGEYWNASNVKSIQVYYPDTSLQGGSYTTIVKEAYTITPN